MRDVAELELNSRGQPEFFGPVKPVDLAALEAAHKFRINSEHRAFLESSGGGFLGRSTFISEEGDEYDVSVLYGCGSASFPGDYTIWRGTGLTQNRVGTGLYPFAESGGGDMYYLSQKGEIFWEIHETNELSKVGEGFTDFLSRLT